MTKAEQELLETGTVILFRVLDTSVKACADREEAYATATLMMLDEDEDKGYNTVEWGAFGFIYTLANLSFKDAAPRGKSDIDYIEGAYLKLEDMMECLKFERGTLKFYCDYLHGRLVKTEIIVHQDGRVEIETLCRGNALKAWLDLLQGKQKLKSVS